jgi:hypothetical protein
MDENHRIAVRSPSRLECIRAMFCGFRRGGSSFVFQALQVLFQESGLRTVDIVALKHNTRDERHVTSTELEGALVENQLVGAFRSPPPSALDATLRQTLVILVVRDPRDCILSWHFAKPLHGHSEGTSLDHTLATSDAFISDASGLLDYANNQDALIVRYEDIVSKPAAFISAIVRNMALEFNRQAVDWAIASLNSMQVQPSRHNHNRCGLPFQWPKHLTPIQQAHITSKMKPLLEKLRYESSPPPFCPDERQEIDALKRLILQLATENSMRITEITSLGERLAQYELTSKDTHPTAPTS